MKKQTQNISINAEILKKLREKNPNESFSDIIGWSLFEIEATQKRSKELGIKYEKYCEANRYIYYSFPKKLDFTKLLKEKIKDANYDDARKSLIDEE